MGILNKVFGNTRKPQGRIGKMMAKSMNSGHAKMGTGEWRSSRMWRHLPSAILAAEADGEDGRNEKWEKITDMKTYTRKEIKEALFAAGFSDAGAFHHEKKPWIAVLARK